MRFSLGAVLACCLAGLQFMAILAVVFSSYLTSERALITHAHDLLRDVGTNAIEHSKGFLSPARVAAELSARLAQNRIIASDDPVLLERLLFQQLQLAPQFAGLYFGDEQGNFVMVMRDARGPAEFQTKIVSHRDGFRRTQLIWRDYDFQLVGSLFDPLDEYDPRTRPWYESARDRLTTIWTDPYIFFTSRNPGITLGSPVMGEQDQLLGVVGVDIEISSLSDFLSLLKIGEHGRAAIIHRNGDVIAHPRQELLRREDENGNLQFVNIRNFGDPIARAAFSHLLANGTMQVGQEQYSRFRHGGEDYVAAILPVISDMLPWTIAVYAPERDFTEPIKRNRAINVWIAALVSLVTAVLGLTLANYIHKPVRAFAVRSSLIAQGEVDPAQPLPRTYKELEKANDNLVQQIVARREAEREYGLTFDMTSRGMAQTEPETGRFIRANSRFCQITGYDADEILRMRLADLCHPDDPNPFPADGTIPDDFAANRELRCVRKDGTAFRASVNAITIRDHAGKRLHAVLTMDDITHIREQEEQISELSRELSHLARGNTMGEMASGLAHELNQPLTAIAQNADSALVTLEHPRRDEAELRELLTEIESQALRAGDIIRALRAFIRKDEGRDTVFDIAELIEQTCHVVRAEATEAGVAVIRRLDPLPPVKANRVQIAQVLVNLLRNAIEAIASISRNERTVVIRGRCEGAQIHICVEDTGPGVPENVKLFSQFETTKPEGMGLGLSICRSIIQANSGRLWHEKGVSSGACFCFTVNQDRETADDAARHPAAGPQPLDEPRT